MPNELIAAYLAGSDDLRRAVEGMSHEQLVARPVPGQWSTLEVICHLADSESLLAERMKRILAEERPPLLFMDPDIYSRVLAYDRRDAEVEIGLVELTRRQMATVLSSAPPDAMERCGVHSKDGPCTLEQVVQKAVTHLQHHLRFVEEKRRALATRPT